ncbi:hypothetical protein CVD28_03390 [Bacillus sp. M6-12]|uniref:hypothetical protein n=1 Tax=Bacillus sp. M6-12 TaxID=2054166 RepID=UPI000C75A4CC|nr:hypothetical protein [Bacillus sp. M6-12]PLS19473.1 hypothetical protein CVD28_03390 [Bacillus sp. M6-12]
MALWVSVQRIKREPFLTISDFHVANYHEIKENFIFEYKGIDELSDYPSMSEVRRYIERKENESKEEYYDRAIQELPKLKEMYSRYCDILNISTKEQEYLEDYQQYEELFFWKRCYDLAKQLKDVFKDEFVQSDDYPILLDKEKMEEFNRLTEQTICFDSGYIYKLSVG